MQQKKNTQIKLTFFHHKYFPALLFSSTLFLCLLSPLKIIRLLLDPHPHIFLPAFIFLSPYFYLHLSMDFPALLFLSFFLIIISVFPLLFAQSFYFFLRNIPCIPVGFLGERTLLADQGQTLLECSQTVSLSLFFSPWLSVFTSLLLSIPLQSPYYFLIPSLVLFLSLLLYLPCSKTPMPTHSMSQTALVCLYFNCVKTVY